MILFFGALFGLISVASGAVAAHGLKGTVSDALFDSVAIAITYNQVNAVIVCTIGLAIRNSDKWAKLWVLNWSAYLFLFGTAMFSFSIYLSAIFNAPDLLKVTPIGGLAIMAAWTLLSYCGILAARNSLEQHN